MIKLWVDFQNASKTGIRLNCFGTINDLAKQKIELEDGMRLFLWQEDFDDNNLQDNLVVEGVAKYNEVDKLWEALIDWEKIGHESDLKK